ncbi:MAG: hypothetical protein ACRDA5_14075 [Clostridium sp.]
MGLLELSIEAKNLLDIQEFMLRQGSLNVPWEFEIYTRYDGIASSDSGKFGEGAVKEVVCVVHDKKYAYVFFDGEFAYLTKMTEEFNRDLLCRNITSTTGKDKYLDEV